MTNKTINFFVVKKSELNKEDISNAKEISEDRFKEQFMDKHGIFYDREADEFYEVDLFIKTESGTIKEIKTESDMREYVDADFPKLLTRDDIGIHYYFNGYEYADGHIYIGDSIYQNVVDGLKITTTEQGDTYDEYLKDTFEGKTEEYAKEHLDEAIEEFVFLEY
ncbi:hypothetical protein [Brachyspira sp.]|uniref:hypothetical protein n=1 Tax=Brachyspira sp. TaxID=1977261 RepID=UPI003D7CD3B9